MCSINKSFAIFLCLVLSLSAKAQTSKIDATLLEKYDSKDIAEYIILMQDRLVFDKPLPFKSKNQKARHVFQALYDKAQQSQKEILQTLRANQVQFRSFYVTNAIKVKSDKKLMLELAKRSDVGKIIDDAPIRMLDYDIAKNETAQRNPEPEWGLKYIKADSVWMQGIRGQGVVVGGQDTGYDWWVSPLKTKYKGYIDSTNVVHDYSWHDAILNNNPVFPDSVLNPCGYKTRQPCDDNNHGTHTMGTMVGEDSLNIIGVAPEAKWIACRNMDRGWGQPSTYIDCFEWFLAPYDLDGENPDPIQAPHVINNSWYCSVEEGCNPSNFSLMEDIVKNLKASGVVVVVSAGNFGNRGCGSVTGPPAFFEPSFSVGATNINGEIAGFSSLGPVVIDSSFRLKPNISAPGVAVRSVIRNGNYGTFSGTSMAGPHVAGMVALIISANPALAGNVEVIENILEASAVPTLSDKDCGDFVGAVVPNAVFGYGIGNVYAAVKMAQGFTSSVSESTEPLVRVYPNPTDDVVTFVLENGHQSIDEIHLYTIGGSIVRSNKYDQQMMANIQINELPKGIYIYKVKSGDQVSMGKFVKM